MKIKLKDFNFKFAIIQVLMYDKKLLKPEFRLKATNPKQAPVWKKPWVRDNYGILIVLGLK